MLQKDSIKKGLKRVSPVLFGYFPVGFAFGVLAVQNGLSPMQAICISICVYAGSSQLIAAGMFGAGMPLVSIVATTFMVNLRHVLMSTALSHWLSHQPRQWLILFGFELTDETFALHSKAMRHGETPNPPLLLTCNITAHVAWVLSTVCGVFFGEMLGDVRPYGLDFTLPAMFLALLIPQIVERLYLLAALCSGLVSVGLVLAGAQRWNVMLATILTASLATLLVVRQEKREGKQAGNNKEGQT